MIKRVTFHRFKQFADEAFDLRPGVSLVGGGNNSGKSSILHGLAIWEFCKTAIEMERGADRFLAGQAGQGLGVGDEEFSPINVPSLEHLWTNLKTQKQAEPDGFTLKIGCSWDSPAGQDAFLEFGLSLSHDRLFVKATDSNLTTVAGIPRAAYLPPFAGMTDRETRLPGAIRRRRIGEGLAGAILRNLLLDLFAANEAKRAQLRGDRSKIRDSDLRNLRENDPWELLQQTLRETFSTEIVVEPFSEEYHSYIKLDVVRGEVSGYKLKRHPGYRRRDLMVEGSGFLQWLSVYALATDPDIDILLLDEPDAHLHAALQEQLVERLGVLASVTDKQVLMATHSTEILRHAVPEAILHVRGSQGGTYLTAEHQKVGLIAGLGSEYAPRVDRIKKTKRVLFVEGKTDIRILEALAAQAGIEWPTAWVVWRGATSHKERQQVFRALKDEIPDLVAVSIRDRDHEPVGTVDADLRDKSSGVVADFHAKKWKRRYIECYLLWPAAITAAAGMSEEDVRRELTERFALSVPDSFAESSVPPALLDVPAKEVFKQGSTAIMGQFDATADEVAAAMPPDAVCEDVKTMLDALVSLAS